MSKPNKPPPIDRAVSRYAILSLLRFASVGAVMLGIAIVYDAVDAPAPLGIVLAFGGLAMFFFGVRRLARRWKSDDTSLPPQ